MSYNYERTVLIKNLLLHTFVRSNRTCSDCMKRRIMPLDRSWACCEASKLVKHSSGLSATACIRRMWLLGQVAHGRKPFCNDLFGDL